MNKWLKYTLPALFIIIGGALFYNKVYVVKSTFELTRPSVGDLHVNIRGIGNLSAKDIYEITAQSGGKIEEIYFDEGEWVKKGELLFSIDPVDLPMLLDETKTALLQAQKQRDSLKGTKNSLDAQRELSSLTYERYKKLLGQKFITQAEYDKAKSDLDDIDARIRSTDAQISSAEFEIKRVQKSIEAILSKLDTLKIYSPVDGYITLKSAQKAQYVSPSQTVFKIVDPKTLWLEANIDERLAQSLSLGQRASIKLRSQPNVVFEGEVERIFAQSNLVTLERKAAVSFDELPTPFFINEQAEVSIMTAKHENVLKIPLELLKTIEGKKGVWVARGENAYFSEVDILAINDEEAAISKGLAKDDELLVLADGKKPLSNGMKIFR